MNNPSPIADQPNFHGMFMLGDRQLFACHMPMFHKEPHCYQMILKISLPDVVMQAYRTGRKADPDAVFNLINSDSAPMTLPAIAIGEITHFPADIYRNYSNANGGAPQEKLFSEVPLEVERVVYFRHFDAGFNYPESLTYLLFGSENEAHLSHYICRDPDFQHLLSLTSYPDWISPQQIQAGVTVNIVGLSSQPIPCSNPLDQDIYQVNFSGQTDRSFPIYVGKHANRWFSTGNMLNAKDPCSQ